MACLYRFALFWPQCFLSQKCNAQLLTEEKESPPSFALCILWSSAKHFQWATINYLWWTLVIYIYIFFLQESCNPLLVYLHARFVCMQMKYCFILTKRSIPELRYCTNLFKMLQSCLSDERIFDGQEFLTWTTVDSELFQIDWSSKHRSLESLSLFLFPCWSCGQIAVITLKLWLKNSPVCRVLFWMSFLGGRVGVRKHKTWCGIDMASNTTGRTLVSTDLIHHWNQHQLLNVL